MSVIWIDRVNEALVILEQSATTQPAYIKDNPSTKLLVKEFKEKLPEWRKYLKRIKKGG